MLFEYLTKDKIAIKYLLVYSSSLFSENDCSYWTRINTRIFCMIYFILSLMMWQYNTMYFRHESTFRSICYDCLFLPLHASYNMDRYMFLWIVHVKMQHWYTLWLSVSYGIKIFVAKECTWMCMKNNVCFFLSKLSIWALV